MYSYEDRNRAVELFIKLGKRVRATIRQLGYPTKNALKGWYRAYEQRLDVPVGHAGRSGASWAPMNASMSRLECRAPSSPGTLPRKSDRSTISVFPSPLRLQRHTQRHLRPSSRPSVLHFWLCAGSTALLNRAN
jgi:transposase-like protein